MMNRGFEMDRIAILIPCYNESFTISKVIADWQRGTSRSGYICI